MIFLLILYFFHIYNYFLTLVISFKLFFFSKKKLIPCTTFQKYFWILDVIIIWYFKYIYASSPNNDDNHNDNSNNNSSNNNSSNNNSSNNNSSNNNSSNNNDHDNYSDNENNNDNSFAVINIIR